MSDLWSTENKVLQSSIGHSAGNGDIEVKPTRYVMLTFWTSKKENTRNTPQIASNSQGIYASNEIPLNNVVRRVW